MFSKTRTRTKFWILSCVKLKLKYMFLKEKKLRANQSSTLLHCEF